jgi:putative nucleotidyltransferase with HDIG domain
LDHQVLDLFSHNVAVALDNLYLNRQVLQTQEGLILMLGEAIEMRSMEAGQHVHRVAEYSALLGGLLGMSKQEVELLRMAAPLHDIGKIAIEDSILNKPGRHSPDESVRMKEHAAIGAKILTGHGLPILDAASQVAAGHQENWDGSGYPAGKKGEDIHIYGRIVALADVFDALKSDRCYKKAWSLEKTLEFVREQRGIKFDPALVDLLCDNLDRFEDIATRLPV